MGNGKKYFLALLVTWAVTLIPSMYYAYTQVQENRIVDDYLSSNDFIGLPVSKETAIRVSDQVRSDFNTKESSFVALKMAERPFLREDVGFLLVHKEGVCGEGTRVIVNLLDRLGFDVTRVTLFNRRLQSTHTLVSVVIDDQEFFVDSINSSTEVTDVLRHDNIASNDFDLMHYSDDILERRAFAKADHESFISQAQIKFFNRYALYSYEATPY